MCTEQGSKPQPFAILDDTLTDWATWPWQMVPHSEGSCSATELLECHSGSEGVWCSAPGGVLQLTLAQAPWGWCLVPALPDMPAQIQKPIAAWIARKPADGVKAQVTVHPFPNVIKCLAVGAFWGIAGEGVCNPRNASLLYSIYTFSGAFIDVTLNCTRVFHWISRCKVSL